MHAKVPEGENIKKVKILGAPLQDVLTLLIEATSQDVVFQLKSLLIYLKKKKKLVKQQKQKTRSTILVLFFF